MPVLAFSHIAIRVADLPRSLHLAHELLGFRDVSKIVVSDTPSFRQAGLRDATMVAWFLERDGTVIELQEVRSASGVPIPPEQNRLGFRHMGFRVAGVEVTAKELEAAGGSVDWPTLTNAITDGQAIFGADPDGQRVELLELAGGPTQPTGEVLAPSVPAGQPVVTRFDHVAVGVTDLRRSVDFYTRLAGAHADPAVATIDGTNAIVRIGRTRLLLHAVRDTAVTGLSHLGFVAPHPAEAVAALISRGDTQVVAAAAPGAVVRDTDGLQLRISAVPAGAEA